VSVVRKHAVLTLIALAASILLIWWIDPDENGGKFLIGSVVIVVNALGAILPSSEKKGPKTGTRRKGITKKGLPPLFFVILALPFVLGACAATTVPAARDRGLLLPDNQPPAVADNSIIPTRTFLSESQIPPRRQVGYGIFALRAMANAEHDDRLEFACKAFLAALPEGGSIAATASKGRMPTIWPVSGVTLSGNLNDCDYLLNIYDLSVSLSAIQDARNAGVSVRGRGPFLIAWSQARGAAPQQGSTLVWDLSSASTMEDFNEAMLIWQEAVTSDPATWQNGFVMERVRLAVRDFSNRWGKTIMSTLPGLVVSR
jgi:hypothetical protein